MSYPKEKKLSYPKFVYLKRLENINKEDNMESKRLRLEFKIKELHDEIAKLYGSINSLKNELADTELEIELLSNYNKYTGFEDNLAKNLMGKPTDAKEIEKDFEKKIALRRMLENEQCKRHGQLEIKLKERMRLKETIITQKATVNEMEIKLKKVKEEKKEVKDSLLVHYHKLLAEGKDTRKEGLRWIIKRIWNLGSKVMVSYLPTFLDEKAISFIFNYASKDIEYAKQKKKFEDFHLKMRVKREKLLDMEANNGQTFGNTHLTFKTELKFQSDEQDQEWKVEESDDSSELSFSVIHKLIERFQTYQYLPDDKFDLKKVESMLKSRGELDEDVAEYVQIVTKLEKQLKELEHQILTMKKMEMDRINKEFFTNDYERRFNVNQEAMISALIGEDSVANEMGRQRRDQRYHFQQIMSLRSFNLQIDKRKLLNNSKSEKI